MIKLLTPVSQQIKESVKRVVENPDTFGTSLFAILLDNYGTEFLQWEPLSIRLQLEDDFNAKIPVRNEHKLWSLVTAYTTNQFHISLEIFHNTCKALSNSAVDFSMLIPIIPDEAAWGVTEVLANIPSNNDPDDNHQFSHEIAQYVGLCLYENGIWDPPTILCFAEIPTPVTDETFAGDTAFFEASYQNIRRHKEELDKSLQRRFRDLATELDSLPLKNRERFLTLKK